MKKKYSTKEKMISKKVNKYLMNNKQTAKQMRKQSHPFRHQ